MLQFLELVSREFLNIIYIFVKQKHYIYSDKKSLKYEHQKMKYT